MSRRLLVRVGDEHVLHFFSIDRSIEPNKTQVSGLRVSSTFPTEKQPSTLNVHSFKYKTFNTMRTFLYKKYQIFERSKKNKQPLSLIPIKY